MALPQGFAWQVLAAPAGEAGPRTGRLSTPHGDVETPAFIPVGTKGAVKGVASPLLRQVGARMVLANAYHLAMRPGAEVVRDLGGLHAMMAWDGPILTDSGGFQVFSLAGRLRLGVTDDGVTFRSPVDGSPWTLTPESAVAIQNRLGADIIMALDECPPYPSPRGALEQAVDRTLRWAARCRAAHQRADQALWAIVQGGVEADLRRRAAEALVAMDFPGYAVGGVSVGEGHQRLVEVVARTAPLLPADRPRYLMGVGEPRDVVAAVRLGMDLFDCVLPTRNGRNGVAFTFAGPLRLRNERFRTDRAPIEAGCDCPACRAYGRGTLRHLMQAGEMLGPILLSVHNLRFYARLFERLRGAIAAGRLDEEARGLLDRYYASG
jgi:queuine tRNA-ribosyltransferase